MHRFWKCFFFTLSDLPSRWTRFTWMVGGIATKGSSPGHHWIITLEDSKANDSYGHRIWMGLIGLHCDSFYESRCGALRGFVEVVIPHVQGEEIELGVWSDKKDAPWSHVLTFSRTFCEFVLVIWRVESLGLTITLSSYERYVTRRTSVDYSLVSLRVAPVEAFRLMCLWMRVQVTLSSVSRLWSWTASLCSTVFGLQDDCYWRSKRKSSPHSSITATASAASVVQQLRKTKD